MKIILLTNVPKLGHKWDIKDVPFGYAKNFLLPRKLAKVANSDDFKVALSQQKKAVEAADKKVGELKELALKIAGLKLEIKAKADENGTIFASVSEKEIAEALAGAGFKLASGSFKIKEPIKKLGEHTVTLEFSQDVKTEVTIAVVNT